VARWIFDTITGPGVKKRIRRDAAQPKKFPGTDGIRYDPNWQDDILDLRPRPKKALLSMKRDETKMEAGAGSPKYPHIKVQLTEKDRNPYAIMGKVNHALRLAGVPKEERDNFFAETTASAYPGVLQTAIKWVSVE
jgi:hypothetical protein